MNVLILGPQGSGKGTQARRISTEYGVAHVATGDMFRAAIAAGTPLGVEVEPILSAGDLVPDKLTIGVMRERLAEGDAARGFVLDGFPRNMAQAEALDELLETIERPLDAVLELQVSDNVCLKRLIRRAEEEGRSDDSPDVIARRLAIYHEETEPLVGHYLPSGKVVGIPGEGDVDQVWSQIQDALERVQERVA